MPPKKRKSQFAAYSVAAAKSNTDEDSNEEDEEDVTILWEQLQAKQRKKMQRLETATEKLQTEKETMEASMGTPGTREDSAEANDVLTINAGGKLITALRSTLTIPTDSMWAYMFSGRWEDSLTRDTEGRIFLDYNHDLIEIIVDYLREKKIEDPSDPLTYPYVPPHKKQSFERMLRYFGLMDFFHPASDPLIFSKANIVQKNGDSLVTVTDDDTNKVNLMYNHTPDGHYRIACTTELDPSGDGVFWKVNIKKLPNTNWIFLGIVGNFDLREIVFRDSTSYGWTTQTKVVKGKTFLYSRTDGMSDLGEGESLYFSLKAHTLKMHRIQKKKTFVIDDIDTNDAHKFYFHIGFLYHGTTVTLEPLDATERAVFD